MMVVPTTPHVVAYKQLLQPCHLAGATFNRGIPMKRLTANWLRVTALCAALMIQTMAAEKDGFVPLFNGLDFSGWKVPEGDNGHWKVVNGVIDYDAESEAKDEKGLTSEREYRDFVLRAEWRIKETPY